jgi:hypothetical protein
VGGTFQPFQGIIAPINNGVLGSVVTVPQVHDLGGIACQGTNACTAVGQDGSGNAIVLPITDAANLTLGSITTITQASGLSDISCPLSTWCVAVGGANVTGPPNDLEGAVVTLPLGGVDAVQLVPGTSGLSSVDCVSASSCVTVGAVFVTCCQANGVVVPIDDGVAGTETTLPSTSTLEGVACWNATSCMASGAQPSDQPGGGNAVLVPITLTPPAPAFSANPTSVTFAPRHIGTTSAPVTVTVTNTGGAPLTFGSVVIGGANPAAFKITTNTCTGSLAPGAQCSTSVTFKPGADKTLNAVLKYTDNAATSPQSIPLSGRGCFNQGGASCM